MLAIRPWSVDARTNETKITISVTIEAAKATATATRANELKYKIHRERHTHTHTKRKNNIIWIMPYQLLSFFFLFCALRISLIFELSRFCTWHAFGYECFYFTRWKKRTHRHNSNKATRIVDGMPAIHTQNKHSKEKYFIWIIVYLWHAKQKSIHIMNDIVDFLILFGPFFLFWFSKFTEKGWLCTCHLMIFHSLFDIIQHACVTSLELHIFIFWISSPFICTFIL